MELVSLKKVKSLSGVKATRLMAEKLQEAQKNLPKGYELLATEAFRSLVEQKRIYKAYYQKLKKENPNWNKRKIKEEAEKFVADPENDPPHVLGRAVDLDLMKNGEKVDMGTESDDFTEKSYTYSRQIPRRARENRRILINAMKKAGFKSIKTEWWHWEL